MGSLGNVEDLKGVSELTVQGLVTEHLNSTSLTRFNLKGCIQVSVIDCPNLKILQYNEIKSFSI